MDDDDDTLPALPWQTVEKRNKPPHGPKLDWMHDGERPQAGVAETLKTGSQPINPLQKCSCDIKTSHGVTPSAPPPPSPSPSPPPPPTLPAFGGGAVPGAEVPGIGGLPQRGRRLSASALMSLSVGFPRGRFWK